MAVALIVGLTVSQKSCFGRMAVTVTFLRQIDRFLANNPEN